MDSNFQMDVILGYKTTENKCKSDLNSSSNSDINIDIGDDKMLPDSSVSPSHHIEKVYDLRIFDPSIEMNTIHPNAKIIVYDKYGQQYYVQAKDLTKIKDNVSTFSDVLSPKSVTDLSESTSMTEISFKNLGDVDSNLYQHNVINQVSQFVQTDEENKQLAQGLLEATDIADFEMRLSNLEMEILKFNGSPLASFVNSANNLESINFDIYEPKLKDEICFNFYQTDENQSLSYQKYDKRDSERKLRMREIYEKYSTIHRWVKINKRKIAQLNRVHNLVDFSAHKSSQLPLPDFVEKLETDTNNNDYYVNYNSPCTTSALTTSIFNTTTVTSSPTCLQTTCISPIETTIAPSTTTTTALGDLNYQLNSYDDTNRSTFSHNSSFNPPKSSDLNSILAEDDDDVGADDNDGDNDDQDDNDNISFSNKESVQSRCSIDDNICSHIIIPNKCFHYKDISFRTQDLPQLTFESDQNVLGHESSPPTPDLRRAELDCNDISEGIRVLVLMTTDTEPSTNNLQQSTNPFHHTPQYLRAGIIQQPFNTLGTATERLWHVRLDSPQSLNQSESTNGNFVSNSTGSNINATGSQNNHHHRRHELLLLSEWQLLEQGAREVVPTSLSQLGPGTRVCANWSRQLPLYLYPGTVSRLSTSTNKLSIDFDDGDHKDIDLKQVRLLPENFPNLYELMNSSSKSIDDKFNCDDNVKSSRKRSISSRNSIISNDSRRKQFKKSSEITSKPTTKRPKVCWTLMKEPNEDQIHQENVTYPHLVRNIDSVIIQANDNIQLLSHSKSIYVAKVERIISKKQQKIMNLKCSWYYNLQDITNSSQLIRRLKKCKFAKFLIFQTTHNDNNDIYSVESKITVLTFDQYHNQYLTNNINHESTASNNNNNNDDIQTTTNTKSNQSNSSIFPPNTYIIAGNYDHNANVIEHIDRALKNYISK